MHFKQNCPNHRLLYLKHTVIVHIGTKGSLTWDTILPTLAAYIMQVVYVHYGAAEDPGF